ncbi:MAG: hypothetical protein P8105_00215 [Dehalococcoidia bacterium]
MMEQGSNERIESILKNVKPSLGGADIRLKSIEKGIVTLEYHKSLSNPSACHVDRTKTTKDMVIEIVEDDIKRIVPDFKKINILGND